MAKARKSTKRASKKSPAKRAPKKATKRKAPKKAASHHIDKAHASVMRALPGVKKADVEALKRIVRACEHAIENARSARD